eukprot:TRINITY_DN69938_c0_g1_i1.p1 TRINITY_DN69938_c0_g1~~TRINITY_DN69938_c0_g1_i1.p1  ORF type:complete len:375 (+),score=118.90 TRINITY_DN69938_c0_g1_i1:86-1210(+)
MADEKPSVLVLGGTGFIGKHLVKYLVDYDIASKVRVADKRPPQLSYMDEDFTAAFTKVDFVQVDLATSAAKAWAGERYGIVVNLASSMEFGKPEAWYEMNILKARQESAKVAASVGCDKYVEVSTTAIYKPADEKGSKPAKEGDPEEPSNIIAKLHQQAEQWVLQNCPTLPVVIVRLPVVYGPADVHGLMPRLLCAASYIESDDKTMTLLYSEDLRVHTCHVQDAVGCIWYLICAGKEREVYNAVDDNDTTQKKINKILEEVFPIKAECVGHLKSKAALKAEKLSDLVEDANEEHGQGWTQLCMKHGADPCGPLTTYLHEEELQGRPNAASNEKSKAVGYAYTVPEVTAEYVRHALQYWTNVRGKRFFPEVMRS